MNVDMKILKLVADGASNLHVISDFDGTLTAKFKHGKKLPNSFHKLAELLGPVYEEKHNALFEKYYPAEISTTLSTAEKMPFMEQWWKEHFQLVVDSGLTREMLNTILSDNGPVLRNDFLEFMQKLAAANVPLLIFSAGLGDIIKKLLESKKLLTSNVHLISNFYTFDEKGKSCGFLDNLIHVFNKNEIALQDFPYAKDISSRKNVLLLGDSIGDAVMADGLTHDCVLKIGFLNEKVEERRAQFQEAFDLVIEGDGSMQPILNILKQISI